MRAALHAEWTKLRTVAGPAWLLLAVIVLTVLCSAGVTSVVTCDAAECGQDATRLALSGVELGQAPVVILAVYVISGEYSTAMFHTTLVATPRRHIVLAAKAVTLTGAVATASIVAVLGSLLAGRHILPGRGFTAAHGYPALSLADGPTLRATFGSILYLVLIGLLSLGTATILRDSATSIGAVLGLLYLFPVLTPTIGDPHWRHRLEQIGPMNAGLSIQATTDLGSLPIEPWAGLAVLAAWAAAAFLAGSAVIQVRDA